MNRPPDLSTVRQVLILRTDHLGDLLLSTPLIRTMRAALPGRHFTLVASPANAGALSGWDALDEIRLFDPKWPFFRKLSFLRELRQVNWDLCLTLSPRTPSYLLGCLSGAPVRSGIIYSRRLAARLLSPLWLTHPVIMRIDEELSCGGHIPHEVEQLSRIAAALGVTTPPGRLELPITTEDLAWARGWLAGVGAEGKRLIGVHGAFKWLSQGWTAGNFLALIRSMAVKLPDAKFLLTFGPGDAALEKMVENVLSAHPDNAILRPGRLSIPHWAALLSLCDAAVSPDTGSLHVAVAAGTPVVALYEADSYAHCSAQWAPWQVPHALVRRQSLRETQVAILDGLAQLLATEGSLS